eukprot:SAG31_NODE_10012_length_1196_cov_1.196901_1_plen_95_part_00
MAHTIVAFEVVRDNRQREHRARHYGWALVSLNHVAFQSHLVAVDDEDPDRVALQDGIHNVHVVDRSEQQNSDGIARHPDWEQIVAPAIPDKDPS